MAQTPELWLPASHEFFMTDADRAIHEEWAALTRQDVLDAMVEPEVVELVNGDSLTVIDKRVEGDNSTEAIAKILPFNNGYTPWKDIEVGFQQAVLDTPTRTLIFPMDVGSLDIHDSFGVKEDIAKGIIEVAVRKGVKKLHVSGYSMGAMLGAAMMDDMPEHFDVSGAGVFLGDAPNVVAARTPDQLATAFQKGGLGNFNKAVNDSGLPVLSRVQRSRGGLDYLPQVLGFARFARSSGKPVNQALRQTMATDQFPVEVARGRAAWQEATDVRPNPLVVRMAKSLICLEGLDFRLMNMSGQRVEVVDDYGHEGGDNIVLSALLGRQAIRQAA